MSKSFSVSIKGQPWLIRLWTLSQYTKKFGKDSRAITFLEDKAIHFAKEYISVGVIRHELMHAMIAESHVESAGLKADQIEEIAASIVQYQWNNIAILTEFILDEFNKPKESVEMQEFRGVR